MALWKPSNAIGKHEYIGRRLFEREPLRGAKDQTRPARTYELYHFEEKRDGEVSVDRLGETSVNKQVRAYLNPRGHHAATKLHKRNFAGWAVTKVKTLQSPQIAFQIVASPIAGQQDDPLLENAYHAHIEKPDRYNSYEMAVMLKHLFEENYQLQASTPLQTTSPSVAGEGWLRRMWRRLWPYSPHS